MDAIRVIGRVDLAQQIHAALLAAGADARLAAADAKTVARETGRDGTGIDVLANSLDVCVAIKRAAPKRPVVIVHIDEPGTEFLARVGAHGPKTPAGPDAYLPWPATGGEILAACERARETARIPRPSWFRRLAAFWLFMLTVFALLGWVIYVDAARKYAGAGATTVAAASGVKAAAFGFLAWQGWRMRTSYSRFRRLTGLLLPVGLAGWFLIDGVRVLLR